MCTETFLRLPEEKRKRFLDAAWEEFTSASFADASINQIVRRANIPRGSFYQYFADKGDLAAYLQEIVIVHLLSEYRGIMEQAGGDIFRTQLLCFDRIATLGSAADVLLDRCIRVVRLNPSLLPRIALEGELMRRLLDSVRDVIDASALRSREEPFIGHTFGMTMIALAIAVAACLAKPADAAIYRQALLTQLDIIKQGSLAEERRAET